MINEMKKKEVYNVILTKINEGGYPPTLREIAKLVGFASTSTVHRYLVQLEYDGKIYRDPSKPRAIKILGENQFNEEMEVKQKNKREQLEKSDINIEGLRRAEILIKNIENLKGKWSGKLDEKTVVYEKLRFKKVKTEKEIIESKKLLVEIRIIKTMLKDLTVINN